LCCILYIQDQKVGSNYTGSIPLVATDRRSCMNLVRVRDDECKGCAICVSVCPKQCLVMSDKLNSQGYAYVQFVNPDACTACGLCFLSCPEPGALTVLSGKEDA